MTKQKAKAQEPAVQETVAAALNEGVVTGDGPGEALPEIVDPPVEQVGAAMTLEPEDVTDAFVLCDGSLDGVTRYRAGAVVQGIPESLVQAHSHWLDAHPFAVEHALNNGAAVIDYQQKA